MNHRILGIDTGTKCGWALLSTPKGIQSGVWNLAPGRHEGGGMRFLKLRHQLDSLLQSDSEPLMVFYELVRGHRGTDAAQIYGGIVGLLTGWCEEHGIPYSGLPVQTIKKHATGKGNAKKDAMIESATKHFSFSPKDDNEADALWIMDLGRKQLSSDVLGN